MTGPDGFAAGLAARGAAPTIVDCYVLYTVEVVEGSFAGKAVCTAVAIDELARWPLIPPHWIYLETAVTFVSTNTQLCQMPDWIGHSRQIVGWGDDPDPVISWLAHVRAVIGEAR
jgi:hypothetical protein